MANSLTTNPIVIDTFTSDIDIGKTVFGDSNTTFFINSIEWSSPSTVDDKMTITDADKNIIFYETCAVAKQSIIKYFFGHQVRGIKIASEVGSKGTIIILLK